MGTVPVNNTAVTTGNIVSATSQFNQTLPTGTSSSFTQVASTTSTETSQPDVFISSSQSASAGGYGNFGVYPTFGGYGMWSYGNGFQMFENQANLGAASQIFTGFGSQNSQLANWFGQNPISNFNFDVESSPNVVNGTFVPGAYHETIGEGGNPNNIMVNISPYASNEALPLADMEAVESYENGTNQTTGWNSGTAAGEALSRDLAMQQNPGFNGDTEFSANPITQWWQNGHQDFINGNPNWNSNTPTTIGPNGQLEQQDQYGGIQTQNQASDQNPEAVGANMMFLNYMHNGLGYGWNQIVNAKGSTLGDKYQSLTGQSGQQGFQNMINAINNLPAQDNSSSWETYNTSTGQIGTTISPQMFTNPFYTSDNYGNSSFIYSQWQNPGSDSQEHGNSHFDHGMAWARPGSIDQIG
jgi:hypothetical protein